MMMSSSLLENPVQAILYLRELTTIVQNQQSLIQTQRTRIEELDRRVDELIGENRHLRDVRVQQHPYHHHHNHHHPDPSCLHQHHHSTDPQLNTGAESLSDHEAEPAQDDVAPEVESSPSQPMDPGEMQLVPADPSTASPDESDPENIGSFQSCRSLVPMTPTTLCRSLSRKSDVVNVSSRQENSFTCDDETPRDAVHGAAAAHGANGNQPFSGERKPEKYKESEMHAQSLSLMEPLEVSRGRSWRLTLEWTCEKEGVERDWRKRIKESDILHQFCCPAPEHPEGDTSGSSGGQMLSLEDGTSSGGGQEVEGTKREGPSEYEISLENKNKQIEDLEQKYGGHLIARRAARRIQTAFRQYQLSKNFQKIRNSLSESKLPRRISLRHPSPSGRNRNTAQRHTRHSQAPNQNPGQTLTQLEDCFSDQLHSLAQSIDDALRGWSLSEGGEGKGLLMDPGALRAAAESACMPRSASSLLMAFRDVTVHIDSNRQQGNRKTSESGMNFGDGPFPEEPEFPAPPPSEELEMADLGSRRGSAAPTLGRGGYQQYHYTHPQQIPGGPSQEALQALVVSLPRDRCQDPASCRSPTLSTDTHRKRLYRIGLNLFNVNPERGIHFLITRGFVPDTAIGVAHFLLQRKGLSRQMIGEFLGNSKLQFNRDVLE
ncbi:IQ motif and SEC7 domain containing protein 3 [Dissostichus eleginoides]|uniref:IQ motif and SEC7 domain containing protein 3 n=1 Tax=Dissostichus eleginoides TaxID=100907 RepID=A0AAD9BQV0_DISEL|nr:IQ motif and SEC7 domain containing protein 3 [Dissostichus eleginoides]